MHVFLLNSQSEVLPSPVDVIGLLVYDANGLDHGRSEAGFKWALEILGAVDMTKSMSLTDLHLQQGLSESSDEKCMLLTETSRRRCLHAG